MENLLPTWGLWILGIAAVGTAVITLTKWLLKMGSTAAAVQESWPVLEDISKEFRPNGGGSMRDVVDRLEADLSAAKDKADERHESQQELNDELRVGQAFIQKQLRDLIQQLGGRDGI